MSEDPPDTRPPTGGARGGLARYVAAAMLARTADGGAVVAIVLLVSTSGAPGWLAGLLGAAITAPHLVGPFIARVLDTTRDGRTVIAWACIIHGVTLAAAVLIYPHTWWIVTALLLIASRLVGPLLTGGISSRLPAIASPDRRSQRRAQGWDVATYGIGGTIVPPSSRRSRPGRARPRPPSFSPPAPSSPPRSCGCSRIPARPQSPTMCPARPARSASCSPPGRYAAPCISR